MLRKMTVADNFCIPAKTEAVVDIYVERTEDDDSDREADFLVEPTDHLNKAYQLIMGSTIVNINQSATCKVRILNPSLVDTGLRQDAQTGQAEKIIGIVSVIQEKGIPG